MPTDHPGSCLTVGETAYSGEDWQGTMEIKKRRLFWKRFEIKQAEVISLGSRMINFAIGKSREIAKKKQFKMKMLSSVFYILNLRKKEKHPSSNIHQRLEV